MNPIEDVVQWKIEDGLLWRWDPGQPDLGWARFGPLDELVRRGPVLELPACTVGQALQAAAELLENGHTRAFLSVLFPVLGSWVPEGGFPRGGVRPDIADLCPQDSDTAQPRALRRALALALRALSDRLLEVS